MFVCIPEMRFLTVYPWNVRLELELVATAPLVRRALNMGVSVSVSACVCVCVWGGGVLPWR